MSTWLAQIVAQLQITDPVFALCLGLLLIIFLVVSVVKMIQPKPPPSLARQQFRQLIDQSIESGHPINVSLAHQGLGTSGLVHSASSLPIVADVAMRHANGAIQANLLCADGIVAAAGSAQLPRVDPALATSVSVDYTGPDPFLAATNSEAVLVPGYLQYTYGQASPDTILITNPEGSGSAPLGGAPTALSGLLLSTAPQDAIFGESYYVALRDPATSIRILRQHNLVRGLVLVGFIIGLISIYLGLG